MDLDMEEGPAANPAIEEGFALYKSGAVLSVSTKTGADKLKSDKNKVLALSGGLSLTFILFVFQIRYVLRVDKFRSQDSFPKAIATWLLSLLWTGIPAVVALRWRYPSRTDLRCTTEYVELEQKQVLRPVKLSRYPKGCVKQFKYVEGLSEWLGYPNYLSFSANGKPLKCLQGITDQECERTLQVLCSMGYQVENRVRCP